MDAVAARPRLLARIPFLHLGLFVATIVTTVVLGGLPHATAADPWRTMLAGGVPFSAALIAILLSHEMGHYLMARAWSVDSTLPFFIPVPFGFGTFGAVIKIRSAIPSRRAVLDIGAAGPIAGFLVAVPLYAWGVAHSEVRPVGDLLLERSNVESPLAILRALAAGEPLRWASAHQVFGDSLATAALTRLVHGPLAPFHEVFIHPVGLAAWLGLFVTTLNLIPVGQLDGGHVGYALLGERRALALSRVVSWGLLGFGLAWSWNWIVWWLIARFAIGPRHPHVEDQTPLDGPRRAVAIASFALFVLTFIPVPIGF